MAAHSPPAIRFISLLIALEGTLTFILVQTLVGTWSLWFWFQIVYSFLLVIVVLFIGREPRAVWSSRYRFRGPYEIMIPTFMALLIPLAIAQSLNIMIPSTSCGVNVCTIQYMLLLPGGLQFPFFAILLPMLALLTFWTSTIYLTLAKLLVLKSVVVITVNSVVRFVYSSLRSMAELVGALQLAVALLGSWVLEGDLSKTLAILVFIQFLLPLVLLLISLKNLVAHKLRQVWYWVWYALVIAGYSFLIIHPYPDIPSIVTLLVAASNWQIPFLASLTLSTLWGMSVARAYVIPHELRILNK